MFIFVEFGIVLLFLVTLIYILKKDKKELNFFIISVIYAILFENMNIILSQDQPGSYYYNKNFTFNILHVPLFVVLSWSIIIYSSKKISQNIPIKYYSTFFVSSLLVLMIDLSLDIVAIRLYYWYWNGYKFNEGFFGVPANNYLGWLLVSFVFYTVYEILKTKKINFLIKSTMTLLASYSIFLFLFLAINSINKIAGFDKQQQFITLAIFASIFLLFIRLEHKKIKLELFSFAIRMPFYIFGLVNILILKIYNENIVILLITILFILFELILFLLAWYYESKQKVKARNS
ncbi:MAG: carotenoid biosynthesis protein [Candidatus Aenigmatarchaeota archaeon]|nr:carotenoid biosynthesis protein [Candidatus Aenigmarchaeota archaeon]